MRELRGIGKTFRRIFFEATLDNGDQSGGHVRPSCRERLWRLGDDLETELGHALGLEWPSPREKLKEHDTERPNVYARIDVSRRTHLLGRHVQG
jgi:hypothetical protein